MSLPSPVSLLNAIPNAVDTVQLSWAEPAASPTIYGYKLFRSAVSLAAAVALAQADITAGGNVSPTGLLQDASSVPVSGKNYTRPHIPATVYYNDVPGGLGTYYYAIVVWNLDGASTITSTTAVLAAHSAPTLLALTCTETSIDVQFNQPVVSPTNRPGEGFTFTVNGAAKFANNASLVGVDTVRFFMAGVISNEDTVKVSYNNAVSNLTNATGQDFAASFSAQSAANASNHAALLGAVCALSIIEPQVVTLIFSMPVTSASGLANGLSFKANGVSTAFASVVPGLDPRQLRVTFAGGFQYRDTLTFSYNPSVGDWVSSGYDIAAFADYPVTNSSRLGTPTDQYPLSSVMREALSPMAGGVDATIGIDLNLIDQRLVDRYGPANVDFGGTFGVTLANPLGVFLGQDLRPIKAGMKVTKRFVVLNAPAQAAIAAAEWLDTMTQRVGTALAALRTTDQAVVLGTATVRQV